MICVSVLQSLSAMFDFARKDVEVSASAPKELLLAQHVDYIHAYEQKKDSYVSFLKNAQHSGLIFHIRISIIATSDFIKFDD